MQATSDKTASANFTQTGGTAPTRGIVGDVTGNAYGRTGYAPYYQWGRKDAFRSAEYTEDPAEGTTLVYKADSVSVGTTIKNPTTHYHYSNNPYSPVYYNAWNAAYTSYSKETTSSTGLDRVVKTVYDPCPAGYTVSTANTFTAFTKDNMPEDDNGRSYTSNGKILYFPYSGCRETGSGKLNYLNQYGYNWVSVNGDAAYGRLFFFGISDSVSPMCSDGNGGSFRSRGFPIRPVREN